MQDFHYNYIKNKYGDKAEMLLTDTASLMHKTKAENVSKDFYNDKELYDLSIYPEDSKYYVKANNVIAGKMKDETHGLSIKDFVGLKCKIYTFITEDNRESEKAKSVNKNVKLQN